MHLTLAVESEQRHRMAQPACRFDVSGGLVGREPSATWVLPDPRHIVSAQHMRISFESGRFRLTDLSRNGTFINDLERPLGKGESHELADGDRIRIGDYHILAQLQAAAPRRALGGPAGGFTLPNELLDDARQGAGSDPLAHLDAAPQAAAVATRPVPLGPRIGRPDDDLADLFAEDAIDADSVSLVDPAHSLPADPVLTLPATAALPNPFAPEPAQPEPAKPGAMMIPEDWDAGLTGAAPLRPIPLPPLPEAAPEPVGTGMAETLTLLQQRAAARGSQAAPVTPPPTDQTPLTALWQALGVDPSRLPPAEQERFLTEIGLAMRELSAGLIQILIMRQGLKSEFRVDQTMMRAVENNLFKFTRTPDELFSMALTNRNRVFLPLDQAARAAFADMKAHEMAMLAAVQLSIRSVLDRFQPQKLRQQAAERPAGWAGRLGLKSLKSRCWDFFTSIYTDLAADADEASNRIFTAEFGRAYRDRMAKPSDR